ncbi:bifunctional riboflavin kinase/FAD synthetase [Bacillus sp. M6-12]|uniref:bifunctional riboflavin kinase/FAD synthetase n=1 Tax=Bacillus sp. M6-12 TaxID=2054166 RepID=UPI000C780A6E|nr:bifunctional riboflavin kinase/FAD synthetase [Bacillus sp. M6-12]PLS16721.1 bifunctional riboflavin kinase/FAD synthetase [Bacillus sp. M6-12]
MEVIKIEHPHDFTADSFPPLSLALGFFDGVHFGHQKVIESAKQEAELKGLKTAVMTFDPHPSAVLARDIQHVHYITPIKDKAAILKHLGVEYLFIVEFTKVFAELLPQQFVDEYIIALNVKHVVAGFDYTYGRLGKGTMETMPFHSRSAFTQTVVEKQSDGEEKISSTRLRSVLKEGGMEEFSSLTGRFYTTCGEVIHGEKRGSKLGFPTANLGLDQNYLLPATGVYAVRIRIKGIWHHGVCNVGYKPTFHEKQPDQPTVEVHVLDFNGNIYGETVEVEWHKRLRSEQKFNGIEELVSQIHADKRQAEEYFKKKTD